MSAGVIMEITIKVAAKITAEVAVEIISRTELNLNYSSGDP